MRIHHLSTYYVYFRHLNVKNHFIFT